MVGQIIVRLRGTNRTLLPTDDEFPMTDDVFRHCSLKMDEMQIDNIIYFVFDKLGNRRKNRKSSGSTERQNSKTRNENTKLVKLCHLHFIFISIVSTHYSGSFFSGKRWWWCWW